MVLGCHQPLLLRGKSAGWMGFRSGQSSALQEEWVKDEIDKPDNKCGERGLNAGGGLPPGIEVDWWIITPPINIIFDRRKNWKEKKQSSPGRAITCRLSFAVMPKPTSFLPPSLTHHLEATHEKKRSCGVLKNNRKKWKFKAHTYALINHPISYSH